MTENVKDFANNELHTEVMAERRLAPIQESMEEMFTKTIELYKEALELFETRDIDKALSIIEADDEIVKLRDDINEAIVIYIVKNAPMASDLRKVITILKVITDIERIAKYTSHFAKFIIKNNTKMSNDTISEDWIALGQEVVAMLEEIKSLYNVDNKAKIFEASARQDSIHENQRAMMKKIVAEIKNSNDPEVIDYYIQLLPILKFQERAGEHAKNICEIYLFLARGKFYNI